MTQAFYEHVVRPLLFRVDPERIHHGAMGGLQFASRFPGLLRMLAPSAASMREREVFGLKFPSVVGLAAGFDKNAVALPAWEAMGFGHIEAGTITAKAQPGNPKPRIFRFPKQKALINRMGFNNEGAEGVASRLEALKAAGRWPHVPVGLNLGKSKVTPIEEALDDYRFSFERLFPLGDYFVLNVSSPNTPGLRKLQDRDALDELLGGVQAVNRTKPSPKPLLLKIAPDLEYAQIEEILGLVESHGFAGIIATNTTLDHSSVPGGDAVQGGLSGAPLRERSTAIVKFIAERTKVPVIGVGGIFDLDSAKEKLDAGAALIQLYTGFVYRGPGFVRRIAETL
jgi:dihydroorotate dehydrogenase